jgi:hypothetical protein
MPSMPGTIIILWSALIAVLAAPALAEESDSNQMSNQAVCTDRAEQGTREKYYADFVYYLNYGDKKHDQAATCLSTERSKPVNRTVTNCAAIATGQASIETPNSKDAPGRDLEASNGVSQNPAPRRLWIAPDDRNW